MTESATENKTSSSSTMMTDWSLLPEDLLHIISENLEDCFDIIHARSVCSSWRLKFQFPSYLLPTSYSLPSFNNFPEEDKELCLEKLPLFLFTVQTPPASASEYFLGGLSRDKSEDQTELPSRIQCSVKVKIPGCDPTLLNMCDCHILPLGHQYRMIGCDTQDYIGVDFLPLNKEGDEFIVLLNFTRFSFVLRSDEMRWLRVIKCDYIDTFRGKFYKNLVTFSIDPYRLFMMPLPPPRSEKYLVPSGNDELFQVDKVSSPTGVLDFSRFTCRVSRLDEQAGTWVEVNDLGERVFFIGLSGNVSCSAKELPDGCGVSGNSIMFINELGNGTYVYKYGVQTGREEDDLNCWRFSGKNCVTFLNTSHVVAFRVER